MVERRESTSWRGIYNGKNGEQQVPFGVDSNTAGAGDQGGQSTWSDVNSLEGSLPIVIYDAETGNEPAQSSGSPVIEGVKMFSGDGMEITGNITISYE